MDVTSGRRRPRVVAISSGTFLRAVVAVALVWTWLRLWQWVMIAFVAVAIAVAVEPAIRWLDRRGLRRAYAAPLLILGGTGVLLAFLVLSAASLSSDAGVLQTRVTEFYGAVIGRLPAALQQAARSVRAGHGLVRRGWPHPARRRRGPGRGARTGRLFPAGRPADLRLAGRLRAGSQPRQGARDRPGGCRGHRRVRPGQPDHVGAERGGDVGRAAGPARARRPAPRCARRGLRLPAGDRHPAVGRAGDPARADRLADRRGGRRRLFRGLQRGRELLHPAQGLRRRRWRCRISP